MKGFPGPKRTKTLWDGLELDRHSYILNDMVNRRSVCHEMQKIR